MAGPRTPTPRRGPSGPDRPSPGLVGRTVGLVAGALALTAGGVAAGFELERRLVARGLRRRRPEDTEPFFSLRGPGPELITPDGVSLHVEVDDLARDAPDDLTVVLVHGYALSMDCWHFQRKYFRDKARVVLYDQRSHGRSGRSAPEYCRIPQLAKDLAQVMEEVVGDGPVVLIGHSMGGMAIMHLARDHPEWFGERVVGVGFCSVSAGDLTEHSILPAIPGRTFTMLVPSLLTTLNRIPQLVEGARKAGSDVGFVATKRLAFGRDDIPNSYVEFMATMLGDIPLSVIEDYYPGFAEVDEEASMPVLSRVELAIQGGIQDTVTPIQHTYRILELLPGAESLVLDKCQHMGIIEHHGEVNDLLGAMVERTRRHLPSAR
ncbi:alpha/beta fold hydrolase [Propionibacteriaceae bacterium Y2011]